MNMKKILAFALCMVLVAGLSIGGTLAWLQAKTDTVTNTFATSDLGIELKEYKLGTDGALTTEEVLTNSYKLVPGSVNKKQPFVRVAANSEASWLFVKVTETNGVYTYKNAAGEDVTTAFADYLTYNIDTANWTKLDGVNGVWYKQMDATGADPVVIDILLNDEVTVLSTVTKEMMAAAKTNPPKLEFVAYAVQQENVSLTEAWDIAKSL